MNKTYNGLTPGFFINDFPGAQDAVQSMEESFERGLENREFEVWCQPKHNAFTGEIVGGEALTRWRVPEGSIISPGAFIEAFEKNGRIVKLDEYIFRTVCELQKKQLDEGHKAVPVSINVSRVTLFNPNEVKVYSQIAEEFDLPKYLVPLEITESAARDPERIRIVANELREAGFFIHLDDFGSGYSSLSSLSVLPLKVVKIDKSLIDNIEDAKGEEVIKYCVDMAHSLKLEALAEGVENQVQLNLLRKLGCNTIQGYFFSKPMVFEDFLRIMEAELPHSDDDEIASLMEEASIGRFKINQDVRLKFLTALADIYMTIHVVNLEDDSVVEFSTNEYIKHFVTKGHGCAEQMEQSMRGTVAPDYLDRVLEFTSLATVKERLKGKSCLQQDFKGIHFDWVRAQFVVVETDEKDDPKVIIFTTQNLDNVYSERT